MSMKADFPQYLKNSLILNLGLIFLFSPFVIAQESRDLLICQSSQSAPSTATFPTNNPQHLISKETVEEASSIPPSLWWAKEQFDFFDGRLVTNWIANTEDKNIDIIVNRQLWSQLNYLERYRLVNKFGTVARENQYNLRVLNQQNKCLVSYSCNFQVMPNQCRMVFESNEVKGFQIPQPQLGEFQFNSP